MKYYKDVLIPEHTKVELDRTTCDICGKAFKQKYYNHGEIVEFGFRMALFYSRWYYEPCDSHNWDPDICLECFFEKLLPLFKSIGLEPNPVELDDGSSYSNASFSDLLGYYDEHKEKLTNV